MEQKLIVFNIVGLWAVSLFSLILSLALARKLSPGSSRGGLKKGSKAPAFSAVTVDGEERSLVDYEGKKALFIFISPHCGSCRQQMPQYEYLFPKARRLGVELVLVSIAGLDETRSYIEETNTHIPVLVAPFESNNFVRDYNAMGTPFFLLVDENGKVGPSGFPIKEQDEWKALVETWDPTLAIFEETKA